MIWRQNVLKKISNFVLGQRKAVHSVLPLLNTLISFIIKKDVCNVFFLELEQGTISCF